jgi:hypothetical protein
MLSSKFKVAEFEVEETVPNEISIEWSFDGGVSTKSKVLFDCTSTYPSVKSLTFDKKKDASLI